MPAPDTDLEEVVPGQIWASRRRLWFSGVRLRARTTIIRLADGRLWVHSPSTPTDAACAALDRLGPVGWIVVPNRFHHLEAPAMKARYPDAQVVGPATACARNQGLVLDRPIDDPDLATSLPELEPVPLDGVPFLDETLFFHRPSQTLIGADLMMCGAPADHWTWRLASRVTGQFGIHKAPPDVRWKTRPGEAVRRSIERLTRLPIERILIAHSDPIVDRPVEQLAAAWRFATG